MLPSFLREGRVTVLISSSIDPELNLQLEDVILSFVENGEFGTVCRFWVNSECLVSGSVRHHSYGWYREDLADRMGVRVFKRSTGGGVVYHDLGNLNWSFYIRKDVASFLPPVNVFKEAADVICGVLRQFGIEARFTFPNRIDVNGHKVSGMAGLSKPKSILVHGTLLIASDISKLNLLCIRPPGCPPVTNLCSLNADLTVERFIMKFLEHLNLSGCEFDVFVTEGFLSGDSGSPSPGTDLFYQAAPVLNRHVKVFEKSNGTNLFMKV
ncbi:MAG: hypothetical protein NZ957_05210 [Thaumarchaeota archaeon]|nr:hypothetical protein [Candidatus Calditenuaceae archaeon]